MKHVQRLAQAVERHHERNVGFRSPLRAGDHIDPAAAERAEQFSGDTRRVFHIFADDRDRGEIRFFFDLIDFPQRDFLRELFSQHFHREIRVVVAHADRGRIFGRRLRDEEYADSRFGERFENPVVDADNADHAQALDRDQAGVVDRRNPFDRPAGIPRRLPGNGRAFRIQVERIADHDRNIFVVSREDRRRIDHLRSEIA